MLSILYFRERYVNQYNVSVRFLATQGGLSRWQHISNLDEGELYVKQTRKNRVIDILSNKIF